MCIHYSTRRERVLFFDYASIYALSKRWPTVFQLMTFQMAEKYSALRFSYCR